MNNLINLNHSGIALITDNNIEISYKKLKELSSDLYKKINHRCLVFCICQNVPDAIVGYLSFVNYRVVPLMLDENIHFDLLSTLIDKYQPKFIWTPNFKLNNLKKFETIFSSDTYSLLKSKSDFSYELNDDLALLLTTSGSTGSPKLVRISYDNILSNTRSIIQYLSINSFERPITTLPMNYSFGLSIINTHLFSGSAILLTNKSIISKEFWTFLKNQEATSLSGVPYTFEMLKKLRFFQMNTPQLKTITQAGGKLNNTLLNEYIEFCQISEKNFFVMYGQTEATARMSFLPTPMAQIKKGSIGIPIPGGDFKLLNDKKEIIKETDVEGELTYFGPNVTLGYSERGEDLILGDQNKGILYTGDIAKRDKEGYYFLVGRKNRYIKIFGNRVNLDEVESLFKNIVIEIACIGYEDKIVTFFVDESKTEILKNYISSLMNIHHSAFEFKHIEVIPKNSSGKINYSQLEKIYND